MLPMQHGLILPLHYGRFSGLGIIDHYNCISPNCLIKMLPGFQYKYISP